MPENGLVSVQSRSPAPETIKRLLSARCFIWTGEMHPVSNKSELKDFRDMLVDIRDKVAALKKAGRTQQETVAAKPTAAHDAKWGQFVIDPAFFTKLVYDGV